MQHSSNSARSNIGGFSYNGENLYWFSSSAQVAQTQMPKFGKLAPEAWYSEMKYYQFAGDSLGFEYCPKRNRDGREQIGHLTQALTRFKLQNLY